MNTTNQKQKNLKESIKLILICFLFYEKLLVSIQGSGSSVPVGTIMWYPRSAPPIGWLFCNGQSTAAYAELAAVVGSNVPDLRGEFIRGWDSGKGTDPGRTFGSWQADQLKSHGHGLSAAAWSDVNSDGLINRSYTIAGRLMPFQQYQNAGPTGIPFVEPTGGSETRPHNISLLPCIKY